MEIRKYQSSDLKVICELFYETSSGYLWIGTRNGLFALKESDKQFLQYTTENGLPSNVIYGILEDAYGRLWISTNQGLSCLNPESGKFRNFTIMDGLQGNQFKCWGLLSKRQWLHVVWWSQRHYFIPS